MRQIRSDLWVSATDTPFPGLNTHAYLWVPRHGDNVLFYSVASENEFDAIARLGGADHQYLSHRDEAGPMLARIADVFGAQLHAPLAEHDEIAKFTAVHDDLSTRGRDANGVDVIPTPGHSPGSTSYLVHGEQGRYLFTGDTILLGDDGKWFAGYFPGHSDADALTGSLAVLRSLRPDLVLSSALAAGGGTHDMAGLRWADCVDEAMVALSARESEDARR